MAYLGDIRLGSTIDTKFCTVSTTGAPTTLAGSPVVSAYLDNNTTQLTAGITLSVDFDSVTGLHNVRVVASGGNGYATATNYQLVVTAGTVGGTSIAGYVIAEFSIENRSALMPTTAGQTLDVSAGGEAGVDWANVGGKTTVNALTNTSIITTQKVDVDTIKTNPVVNGGTITFPTTATLASTTNITAGTITTATNVTTVNGLAANTITATSIQANALTAAKIATDAIGAAQLAADAVTEIQNGLATPTNITAGTITTATNVTNVNGLAANTVTASALATDAVTEIVTAVFARAFSAAYGSYTFDEMVKLIAASLLAKCSGMGTATGTFRNLADSADTIVATLDASGNRTAVTRTP